jgi:hypothetical protein
MKKRVFLIATIMTLIAVCAFGQSARKSYKAGMEFVDNLKYDDAVVQFTSAIGLEPSNPDYYYARGRLMKSCQNILKLRPILKRHWFLHQKMLMQ